MRATSPNIGRMLVAVALLTFVAVSVFTTQPGDILGQTPGVTVPQTNVTVTSVGGPQPAPVQRAPAGQPGAVQPGLPRTGVTTDDSDTGIGVLGVLGLLAAVGAAGTLLLLRRRRVGSVADTSA